MTKALTVDEARPRVVTLCGSSRFPEAFHLVNAHLSMQGIVVISLGCFGHADEPRGARFLTSDGNEQTTEKQALDQLHFRKIDISDGIFVVNVGGYVGSSTRREIDYARSQGKTVEWLFPPESAVARQEIAALSDGDRTRAEDAQVGGGAGQAGNDVVLDAASRLREADHQALANTLQVHDAKQRQHIANLVQALRLQMIYEATIPDRGGKNGPKGRAYAAFVQARDAALKEVSSWKLTSADDKAILKAAVEKIKRLPPMDFEPYKQAAANALREAAEEHEAGRSALSLSKEG